MADCTRRESNPDLLVGSQAFCHWNTSASADASSCTTRHQFHCSSGIVTNPSEWLWLVRLVSVHVIDDDESRKTTHNTHESRFTNKFIQFFFVAQIRRTQVLVLVIFLALHPNCCQYRLHLFCSLAWICTCNDMVVSWCCGCGGV